jgi:uncharacterized protein (TIGR02611 family)
VGGFSRESRSSSESARERAHRHSRNRYARERDVRTRTSGRSGGLRKRSSDAWGARGWARELSITEGEEQKVGGLRRAIDRVVAGYQGFRSTVARNRLLDLTFRIVIGTIGLAVVIFGVIALPAPGPGWAIIFLGLGILAAEFESARKVLTWVRAKYQAWAHWLGRQHRITQLLVLTGILLVVAACAWFVGAFALVGSWMRLEWDWLKSPVSTYFGL